MQPEGKEHHIQRSEVLPYTPAQVYSLVEGPFKRLEGTGESPLAEPKASGSPLEVA